MRLALTFDDGPHTVTTPRLLDGLAAYNAKAMFFLLGESTELNPAIAMRMLAEGHAIGSHAYTHDDPLKLPPQAHEAQLDRASQAFARLLSHSPNAYRPPYGHYNAAIVSQAAARGMAMMLWDLEVRDWDTRNADYTYTQLITRVKDGDIILLHDVADETVDAVLRFVADITEKSGVFLTPDAMFGGLAAGRVYGGGKEAAR